MVNLYIVENDMIQVKYYEQLASDFFRKEALKATISIVQDNFNIPLVSQAKDELTIFFIDLDLGTKTENGYTVAKKIRDENPLAYIVIITSHLELMAEQFTYHISAFDFIHKNHPRISLRLKETLSAIYEDYQNLMTKSLFPAYSKNYLMFEFKGIHHKIELNEIVAIDTDIKLRSTIVHTMTDSIRSPFGVAEILSKLPENFVKSHRAIILNIENVEKIEISGIYQQACMTNNEKYQISKKYAKTVLEKFYSKSI